MFHRETKKCSIKAIKVGRLNDKAVLTIGLRTHITEDELRELGMEPSSLGAFGKTVTGPKALATHALSIGAANEEWTFDLESPLAKPKIEVAGAVENDDGETDVNYFMTFEVSVCLYEEAHRGPTWEILRNHGLVVSVDFRELRTGDLFAEPGDKGDTSTDEPDQQ